VQLIACLAPAGQLAGVFFASRPRRGPPLREAVLAWRLIFPRQRASDLKPFSDCFGGIGEDVAGAHELVGRQVGPKRFGVFWAFRL
jgi:hypothetical protein